MSTIVPPNYAKKMKHLMSMAEQVGKYDSGIDTSVVTYNLSSMSLNSFDSSFDSTVSDVLNRARIDSVDEDLSIKDELNQALILSQDFTLDSTDFCVDEEATFNQAQVNFSITLTNNKQDRNKENILHSKKFAPRSTQVDGHVKNIPRHRMGWKTVHSGRNEIVVPDKVQKAKPLSPNKDIRNTCRNPNVARRTGLKNTRKKRTVRTSPTITSPPKSPNKEYSPVQSSYTSVPKKSKVCSVDTSSNGRSPDKFFKNNVPISIASLRSDLKPRSLYSNSPQVNSVSQSQYNYNICDSPQDLENSVYVTPLQTPSKLFEMKTPTPNVSAHSALSGGQILNSPNITYRTPSPGNKLLNSPNIMFRSPSPSDKLLKSPNVTVRSSPSRCVHSTVCHLFNNEDLDLSPPQTYRMLQPNQGKVYFSPLLDDSAIVEASCSGRKYISPPEQLNPENVWKTETEMVDCLDGNRLVTNNLFVDFSDQSHTPLFGRSPLGEKFENFLELPGSPYLLSRNSHIDEKSRLEFQNFLDRLEGTHKVRKKLSCTEGTPPHIERSPLPSPLCCDSRLPDELSEAELDEITWIHTTCNGQQVAHRVSIEESLDDFAVFPPPRTPRHLKWNQDLERDLEENCDITEKHNCSTLLKPILRKRPESHVFPYNGDEPSPYMITRTRHVHSSL